MSILEIFFFVPEAYRRPAGSAFPDLGDGADAVLVVEVDDADHAQSVADLGRDAEVEHALPAPPLQGILVDGCLLAVAALARGEYELLVRAGRSFALGIWAEAIMAMAITNETSMRGALTAGFQLMISLDSQLY